MNIWGNFVGQLTDTVAGKGKILPAILLIPLLLLHSCKSEEIPPLKEYWFMEIQSGNGERILPGESINVVLEVKRFFSTMEGVRVDFEILSGGGSVSDTAPLTDASGKVMITWMPGNGSSSCMLKASVYAKSGECLVSSELTATCFINDSWIKVTSGPDKYVSDVATDTVAGVTYMIAGEYRVFRQGKKFFEWELVDDPLLRTWAHAIEADNKGVIYVVTYQIAKDDWKLVRSSDHGKTWKLCTSPYNVHSSDTRICLANDNTVWACMYGQPVKFSSDEGVTWNTAGSTLSASGFAKSFRLSDGSLLFFDGDNLNKSADNGLTWTLVNTPGDIINLYLDENDEIIIASLGQGFTIYKSEDKGNTFKIMTTVFPKGVSVFDNFIYKWNGYYFIVVPEYCVMGTYNFRGFDYIVNENMYSCFMDHNGILIAKGKDFNSVYYYKKSK